MGWHRGGTGVAQGGTGVAQGGTGWHRLFTNQRVIPLAKRGSFRGCAGVQRVEGIGFTFFGTGWHRLLYCNPPRSSYFGAEINRKCIIERTLDRKGIYRGPCATLCHPVPEGVFSEGSKSL